MTQVIPFNFDGFPVDAILRDGEPWFVLGRVCRVLGLDNASYVASRFPEDEKTSLAINYPPHGLRDTTIINERGLWRLVLTSRKPEAERFKTWIVGEVIPTIRKTGGYGQPAPVAPNLRDPRTMAAIAAQLVEINEELNGKLAVAEQRVAQSEAKVATLAPKAQAYEDLCEADGNYGLQNAGRILRMGPNTFVKWLKAREYLFDQGGVAVPFGKYCAQGLFSIKARDVDGKWRTQTYVTPKGLAHFHRLLNPQGDLLALATMGSA
jgi:anti-repressor protein